MQHNSTPSTNTLPPHAQIVDSTSTPLQNSVFPIACTACRLSHRKCSKTLPICDQCSSRGIQCVYQDRKKRAPKRPDGQTEQDSNDSTNGLEVNSSSLDHDSSSSSSSPILFRQNNAHALSNSQQLQQLQQKYSLNPSSTENTLHRLHDRVNFFASVFFDHLSTVTYPSFISKEKLLRLLLIDQQQELKIPHHLALQHSQNKSSPPPAQAYLLKSEQALILAIQALCLLAAGYKTESQEKFVQVEEIVNDFWFNILCGHTNDASIAVDAENIMCCMCIMSLYFAGAGLAEKCFLYQDMYKSLLDAHKKYFSENQDVKKLNPDFWEGILFFDRISLLVNYSKADYINKVKLYKQLKITIFSLNDDQLRVAKEKEAKPFEVFSSGKLEALVAPPDKLIDVRCFDVAVHVPFDPQSYISEQATLNAAGIVDQALSEMFMSFNQVITYGPFRETDDICSDVLRFAGIIYFYSLKVQAFFIMRQKVMALAATNLAPQFSAALLHLRKLIIQNASDIASLCRHSKLLGLSPYQTTTELRITFEILIQEFEYSRIHRDGLFDPSQMDTWLGYLLFGFEIFSHRYDSTLVEFGDFIRQVQQFRKTLQISTFA